MSNFDKDTMQGLEANWEHISHCLHTAVRLLASFGFSRETLLARSVIIPMAYYIHVRELPADYVSKDAYAADRAHARRWVVRSLLKRGVWGSGLDGLLTGLRAVLQKHHERWPSEELEAEMARRGKSLRFEAAEVDDLAALEYGDARVFPLLALLYPGVDTTQQFHVDHIFPKSRFTKNKLRSAKVPEESLEAFIRDVNRIPNLQLLPGPVNVAKLASLPHDWLGTHFREPGQREQWLLNYDAAGLPEKITGFGDFSDTRRKRLRARLSGLLGVIEGVDAQATPGAASEQVDEAATLV